MGVRRYYRLLMVLLLCFFDPSDLPDLYCVDIEPWVSQGSSNMATYCMQQLIAEL
jgi:hypothetical protein